MKKSAKQAKTVVAQEPKKSIVEVVKEDVVEEGFTKIKKMDFELVDTFQSTLAFVFFPEGLDVVDDTDDVNDRYLALWHIFLATVGWTDNEYWAEYKVRPHHCHDCGSLIENDEHVDEDDALDLKVPGAKSLPPNAKSN